MSESQSIRRLHISDPTKIGSRWRGHCSGCGWDDGEMYDAYDDALRVGVWHARRETLAQIRLERSGGSGWDDGEMYDAYDDALRVGVWHARRETLAQIRLERSGGSGGDDAA
jgi:Arc/MetJ family transcription regulator